MMDLFEKREHLKDLPIYAVLGNHDCRGSVDAMVEVSGKDGNKWAMEGLYYSRSYDIDSSREGDELGFVFLNSCMLTCVTGSESYFCSDNSEPPTQEAIQTHYDWLKATLQEMVTKDVLWKVALIHTPINAATDMEWN